MRIPNAEHQAHPWLIDRIAPDFELLDVWALPVEGGRDDFDTLLARAASADLADGVPLVVRALFWVRLRLGAALGWDDATTPRPIPGCAETTLRARLPEELHDAAHAGEGPSLRGFTPLYRTADEWTAEVSNGTVHGVLQLAWAEQEHGRYRARLAVYVKERGRFGRAYMTLIQPFRHHLVYPALVRRIGRLTRAR